MTSRALYTILFSACWAGGALSFNPKFVPGEGELAVTGLRKEERTKGPSPPSPCRSNGKAPASPIAEGREFVSNRRLALVRMARMALFPLIPFRPWALPSAVADGGGDAELTPSLFLAQPMGPPGSEDRPTAPLEYLIPAARVRVYIDNAVDATEKLIYLGQTADGNQELVGPVSDSMQALDKLLATPPSFVRPQDPKRRIDQYAGGLLGEFDLARKKQKEREANSVDVALAPRAFEVFELSGERRQWNRLQKQERAREEASTVRLAFNIYTSNLFFGEKYRFKASKEEKSKLIRADRLPTVTSVIRSDLDLRDLYRNQVQTALEDAWAEYEFQSKQSKSSSGNGTKFEAMELMGLLKDAQVACQQWLSFIPETDVEAALEMAKKESSLQ